MAEDPDKTVIKSPAGLDNDATVIRPTVSTQSAPEAESPVRSEAAADKQTLVNPSLAVAADDKTRVKPLSNQTQLRSGSIDIGSIINNRFVIDQLLGVGGMGVVYRALDKRKQEARDRDPYVAIKILSNEFKDHPQAFVALQREARKSQTLAHPNIITVYDFDRDGDIVYMTMEELHGQTLETFIKNNPQGTSIEVALPIIKSIAQGLAYAHLKKIVHSDLKPGNVFISEEKDIKILDFGIARAVSAVDSVAGDKTLFDAGKELSGLTPSYASSEMFAGAEPHPSDDVYALGLIAYELLTGLHPYFRKPATKAVQEKLRADRLKGIKGFRARTLLASVALRREDRIADAAEFLAKFEKTRTPIVVVALIVVLSLSVATYSYIRPVELGPEIPFEQLAPDLQSQISSNLGNGNEALRFNDYNGALQYFNDAYELHPRNPDAESGLEAVVKAVLNTKLTGSESEIAAMRLQQVNSMLEYSALADHADLIELRDTLQN